jgi:hypothetical protein
MTETKIGVLSCSGEECLGGTISRLATRKMLEKLRIGKTVTLCINPTRCSSLHGSQRSTSLWQLQHDSKQLVRARCKQYKRFMVPGS